MSTWRVGFAETEITPGNNHAFMSGFGQERYATGKLAPLMAQALVLEDARKRRSIIIAADVAGFERTGIEAMRFRMQRDYRVKPQSVMFCASHTHWGPGIQLQMQFYCGAISPWYTVRLEKMIHETVGRAIKNLSAAQLRYGAADTAIGCNRRVPGKNGRVPHGMRPNPAGHYDRHTPVFHVKRRGRKHDIVLVSHACHPTSTGIFDKWTPDYPGHMRDAIEKHSGAKGMFAMGCGGAAKVCTTDRKTGETVFVADVAGSRRAGRNLAKAVLNVVDNGDMIDLPAQLTCREHLGHLTMKMTESDAELRRIATQGDPNDYRTWTARKYVEFPCRTNRFEYGVHSMRFGRTLTLLGLEGEVCSPLGPMARAIPKTQHAAVFAYTNSTHAYIPDKRILWEGGYEADHRNWGLPGPFTPKIDDEFKRIVRASLK